MSVIYVFCEVWFNTSPYVRRRKRISGIHHKTFFAACLILKNPAWESSLLNAVMIVFFSLRDFNSVMQSIFIHEQKKNKYDIYEIKRFSRIIVA